MSARRLMLMTLASLCALPIGSLSWSSIASAAEPPAAPLVEEGYAANVAATSATLAAQVDPDGLDTTAYFQYGTTSCKVSPAACIDLPALPGADLGAAFGEQELTEHLQNLQPNTTYHFRTLASNELGSGEGSELTFTTQPIGTNFVLPDGREWEQVSPQKKYGATITPIGSFFGAAIQASNVGGAIAYAANNPTEEDPSGNRSLERTEIFSKRGPGGWESRDITTPSATVTGLNIGNFTEYVLFSEDLSLGYLNPKQGTASLPPLPEGAERTPYLRHDLTGAYEALFTSANTSGATGWGSEGFLRLLGTTPDLSHLLIWSRIPIAPEASNYAYYEWSDGESQPVSVLPADEGGQITGAHPALESRGSEISKNGSRVVWTQWPEGGGLYLRDMTTKETVRLDLPQGGEGGQSEPDFETANSEETQIFFTDGSRLTAGSTAVSGAPDLYEFKVTSASGEPLAGKLTDLTVDNNPGESASVIGVVGAAENGSDIYFAAAGVLGEAAKHGAEPGDNIYVEKYNGTEWTPPTFIASGVGSGPDFDERGQYIESTARVTPNGRYLAFMSTARLTGYDNRDANSGAADAEVFLYDASTGRLVCASCNPSGSRPAGMYATTVSPGPLVTGEGTSWDGSWLAGSVPAWTNYEQGRAFYQSRYLSNNGRLFFNSPDALVPANVNGQENVYEYEPEGVGSCHSTTLEAGMTFNASAGGCVGLVSAGTSSEESVFMDASEEGREVFFMTAAPLTASDVDNAYDVYDAHECTAAAPCMTSPVKPPECTTAEGCRNAPTPQPAIFGAPASATFSGAGNVAPPVVPPLATRAQKLAKTLKSCRRERKKKRGRCEAQARKAYGKGKSSRAGKSLPARTGR
jgi:hypothetical protein